ncbi:hypothetical protein M8J76_014756 [Diaphorina citri]|nr:hypothetical protein M8J76_014756 [Diaphorina citri]
MVYLRALPLNYATPVAHELSFYDTGYNSLPRSNYSTDFRSSDLQNPSGSDATTLETVSEDAESARQRLHDHPDNGSEYTVRDSSFDRSSCEQLNSTNYIGGSNLHSRSTPINHTHTTPYPPLPPPSTMSLVLTRIFLHALLLASLLVFLATVLILETDSELLGPLRKSPEMILLRREFYEPAKKFVKAKIQGYW